MTKLIYNVNGNKYTTLAEAQANGYNSNYHTVEFVEVADEAREKRCAEHREKVNAKLAEMA